MPVTDAVSWTVVDDGVPVEPAEKYLAYRAALERSPNTVRAYALSLKLLVRVPGGRRGWLGDRWRRGRLPVRVVAAGAGGQRDRARHRHGRRSPATLNRHLAAVFGFYEHHARAGIAVAADLVAGRRVGRGSYKPLLHRVTRGRPIPTRPLRMVVVRQLPRTLEATEVVAVLAACERARDRFLLSLLAETGMWVGQALGRRHADFVSRAKDVHIVPRDNNANGARAKLRSPAVVPVSAALVSLYSDYMHSEYGEVLGVIAILIYSPPAFSRLAPGHADVPTADHGIVLRGPGDVAVVTQIYEPGQTSGWHTHAGLHAVAVLTGELTVYDGKCRPQRVVAGEPYVGGRELHLARNETAERVEMVVTYLNAVGTAPPHAGAPAGCRVR